MDNILNRTFYHNSFPKSFEEKNFNVPIYRIIPFYRLLEILKTNQLYVSQTIQWEDTYENFLAKSNFKWGKIPITYANFLPCFYGQCWSLSKETDALWRIYSLDKCSVRIKTTICKLLSSSCNEPNYIDFSTKIRIVGKVTYFSKEQLAKWVNNENKGIISEATLRESLFLKRKEFSHEKEVRLVINKTIDREDEFNGLQRKGIILNITSNDFIDEVMFDPRISNTEYETYLYTLKKIGYQNKISKSNLYNFLPLEIIK